MAINVLKIINILDLFNEGLYSHEGTM